MIDLVKIKQCFLTQNDCMKAGRTINPTGIVIHSTGCNQKKVSVFLNSWNKSGVKACVHAFIGVLDDGNVGIVQTMPWNRRPWGCGMGKKGSFNNSHIQFEICEDALSDEKYFVEVFAIAADLCVALCKEYGIDPQNVVSHAEAHKMGYATNHADCDHWLKNFGVTMNDIRRGIEDRMKVKYSTDTTVQNMIEDGVTTKENARNWEIFLAGGMAFRPEYVRAILDRYHDKLIK